ncbi:MAG: homoserine kinase [Epsilonproteobacteria bacterium]|nr:homoserine kinase [Campylobacterota bacterium]
MLISTPATSANLGPGFDTLGLSLNLRNEVEIKFAQTEKIEIYGENAAYLKTLPNNMFVNIFTDVYQNLTGHKPVCHYIFNNKIPISRGLGSSSALIIAAITAAYEIAQIPYKKDKILNYALSYEHHPDNITPATLGGFCVSKLKRNKVYFLKKSIPNTIRAVVVIPNNTISTSQSRLALKEHYMLSDVVTNISSSSMITAAFFSEKFELLRNVVEDKVHQEARMKAIPELFKVREIALREGALMSTLSGSGSTYFNLAYRDDAYSIYSALKSYFPNFTVKMLNFDNVGVKVFR